MIQFQIQKGKYGPRYLFSFSFLLSLGLLSLLSSLCCLFYNDSSLGLVLIAGVGDPGVDQLASVGGHLLDQPLLCQLIQSTSGKRSSNLQPLRDNAGCDELVGGNLLVQFVIGILVKQNQVVQLVPGLSLGPLLLLGLATTASLLLLGILGRSLRILLGILFGSHVSCRSESSNIS